MHLPWSSASSSCPTLSCQGSAYNVLVAVGDGQQNAYPAPVYVFAGSFNIGKTYVKLPQLLLRYQSLDNRKYKRWPTFGSMTRLPLTNFCISETGHSLNPFLSIVWIRSFCGLSISVSGLSCLSLNKADALNGARLSMSSSRRFRFPRYVPTFVSTSSFGVSTSIDISRDSCADFVGA